MKGLFGVALLGVLLAVGLTHAADKEVVKADTKEAFAAVAENVRSELGADGRYAYLKPDEREKVDAGLAEMSRMFEEHDSVEHMDKATRVKLFNTQETVNALLTLRDRDRLICERGAQPGSRIVSTSCHTYGDLEAAHQASAKFMNERAVTPCNGPPCTGH
ncbi:MAG TPA: hypothetical protein VGO25_02655 [Rhodanobacteraceae bacterium]|jgi:hypothetical protein|nr:hypothetical protein [Rhodanobacteraceae bacterium]